MEGKILTQKVNFFLSACLIASFGALMTSKIIDAAHASDPIINAVAQTEAALYTNN